ncbi:hypothetical protein G4B88_028149 [Cannabis sativa]|uniref:Uncharacterized protein n=1 Tax=Cannabis sativa TaxID=3483 RepID=A0A7J6HU81_CANSA|nr:hypothetical protein G4B88_028149 [Cannabis sativa]
MVGHKLEEFAPTLNFWDHAKNDNRSRYAYRSLVRSEPYDKEEKDKPIYRTALTQSHDRRTTTLKNPKSQPRFDPLSLSLSNVSRRGDNGPPLPVEVPRRGQDWPCRVLKTPSL